MYTAISILIVIASILLTVIVLIQNSKGGGLAANFAAGNQTFGVRQTADFLEKATWTLAITIIVLCILATAFVSTGGRQSSSSVQQKIENTAPVQGQPQFPTSQPATNQPATNQPATQPENQPATQD
ncbi:MAG: preprotein translocase subunit SecG [Bacteroidales bacterium]|nr:preprotein translocase subunit SecG [Bacteroidales bacterium]MDD2426226.1 preprotein translocase subunit SecG [Bacteroidales bacterium]MDD3990349.1 preprotein translocase subunit SecG [Bacteroidales bacterium]MDD4639718.1 preprotein translocase subunit SecG [Bacteroidales bacterium]